MGLFDIFKKKRDLSPEQLKSLLELLREGKSIGLTLPDLERSLARLLGETDGKIKIVLLGSFSDGKTSVVAGMMGKVADNMKIDQDESSDELAFYSTTDMKNQGFEFVDTPGLFGTKEKEYEGGEIRKFSSITEKYISEAHIVMYVGSAVNTLKDSHSEIIRKVLRDYGKLPVTIFVLNKMDETGCDLEDDNAFAKMSETKRNSFIGRLETVIGLTPEEKRDLKIACVAADPSGRGFDFWFNGKRDFYEQQSHISSIRSLVDKIMNGADKEALIAGQTYSVMKDATTQIKYAVDSIVKPLSPTVEKGVSMMSDSEKELEALKHNLHSNLGSLRSRINIVKEDYLNRVHNMTMDTVQNVVDSLGTCDGKVTFYQMTGEIDTIIKECMETNNTNITTCANSFETDFARQDGMMMKILSKGAGFTKNVNAGMVKSVRDVVCSGFKFKPWGAVKLAKGIGIAGAVISVGIDIYSWIKKQEAEKEFAKTQTELRNAINDIFSQIEGTFRDDESFFKNYAPSYIELRNSLAERKSNLSKMQHKLEVSNKYSDRLKQWMKNADIEDVEYVEM